MFGNSRRTKPGMRGLTRLGCPSEKPRHILPSRAGVRLTFLLRLSVAFRPE